MRSIISPSTRPMTQDPNNSNIEERLDAILAFDRGCAGFGFRCILTRRTGFVLPAASPRCQPRPTANLLTPAFPNCVVRGAASVGIPGAANPPPNRPVSPDSYQQSKIDPRFLSLSGGRELFRVLPYVGIDRGVGALLATFRRPQNHRLEVLEPR